MTWWRSKAANETPAAAEVAAVENPDALLRRLEWTVLRRLDGRIQGVHRTFMRGGGIDLADLREYQPHDDVRRIDWNVTARLQQPHVRQFMEERDLEAWFVLDLSPSLVFGSGGKSKLQLQMSFVALLARLLTSQGNRVGGLLFGAGADQVVSAGGGRHQVLRLLHAMRACEQSVSASSTGSTSLGRWLRSTGAFARRRGVLFVLSDFISEPGWERDLGALARRHEVLAVRLFDPLEMQLPGLGLLPLRDSETGARLWVDTQDPGFRVRFERLVQQRENELRLAFVRAGVDVLEVSTEEDLGQVLLRWFALRRRHPGVTLAGMPSGPLQGSRA